MTDLEATGTNLFRGSPTVDASGTYDWSRFDLARQAGAKTELILSNIWKYRDADGSLTTPWSDWNRYSTWVHDTVQKIVASGEKIDYWDIYNEPGWIDYYSSANWANETLDEELQQFLVAYQQIKSVDPSLAVVGPSFGQFRTDPVPPETFVHQIDFVTFLKFAAEHKLRLAAIAWHDNGQPPALLQSQGTTARSLINAYPQLGQPMMFLDEYGLASNQTIPGWDVAFLSAIQNGGFAGAARSCWNSDCASPALDGLLDTTGTKTTSDYLVRTTYASMTGQMMGESSTTDTLTGLGSINSASDQIVALVGRSASCAVQSWCASQGPAQPGQAATPASAAHVQVRVVVPWTASQVSTSLSYESFQPGTYSSSPRPDTATNLTVSAPSSGHETITFDIPQFADGTAYNIRISPK